MRTGRELLGRLLQYRMGLGGAALLLFAGAALAQTPPAADADAADARRGGVRAGNRPDLSHEAGRIARHRGFSQGVGRPAPQARGRDRIDRRRSRPAQRRHDRDDGAHPGGGKERRRNRAAAGNRHAPPRTRSAARSRSRRGVIAEVLAALQRMGRKPPPAVLAAPGDMLQAIRTSMLLGAVLPELRGRDRRRWPPISPISSRVRAADRQREGRARQRRAPALAEERNASPRWSMRARASLEEAEQALDAERDARPRSGAPGDSISRN